MRTGTYKLARQIGGRGVYASVSVSVIAESIDRARHVEFAESCDPQWRAAVRFGLDGALAILGTDRTPRGLVVVVTDIGWVPVDTRFMTVAYAAAEALWDALGYRPSRRPEMDENATRLSFPV